VSGIVARSRDCLLAQAHLLGSPLGVAGRDRRGRVATRPSSSDRRRARGCRRPDGRRDAPPSQLRETLAGREIEPGDRAGSELVLLVNEALAKRYFPNETPIGHEIEFWGTKRKIVGVLGNEHFLGLRHESEPALYPSLYQVPMGDVFVVLRSARPFAEVLPMMQSAMASVDPDIPLTDAGTLSTLLDRSLAPERFTTVLLSIFGTFALALAAIGVFGLVAYQVSLRLRELGIRSALGAERFDLVMLIFREAAVLSTVAVIVGWLGAFSLTRFLERFLFGVTALDPATFAMSGVVLTLVGLAGAAVPALRAARVDPVLVLRAE
jgi:putative ABC transport system permease protein